MQIMDNMVLLTASLGCSLDKNPFASLQMYLKKEKHPNIESVHCAFVKHIRKISFAPVEKGIFYVG